MNNVKRFTLNTEGNDYIVGDIHGCFPVLKEALIDVGFDFERDRLFSTGDIVDRGLYSEECHKWLDKPWFHSVMGNHEKMLIDGYERGGDSEYLAKYNGGGWFFKLPEFEKQCYVELFKNMPLAIEIETSNGWVGVVHAHVPYDDWDSFYLKHAKHLELDVLWNRAYQEVLDNNDDICVSNIDRVFVGHTPHHFVTSVGNVTMIDVGVVFGLSQFTFVKL